MFLGKSANTFNVLCPEGQGHVVEAVEVHATEFSLKLIVKIYFVDLNASSVDEPNLETTLSVLDLRVV